MRKFYLAILYIITMVCIFVGLGINVGKWGFFGKTFNNSKSINQSVAIDGTYDSVEINVDCKLADVKIMRGDSLNVRYNENEKIKTNVKQEANIITVTQQSNVKNLNGTNDIDIEITVPANVKVATLNVHNNLGDIKIENLEISNCVITEDLGDVKVSNCTGFNNLTIDNNLGDIAVISCEDWNNYSVYLDVALGDINFYGNKTTDKYTMNSDISNCLVITDSLGDITVK